MTTKTLFDQVLSKNPSMICKWAAEDVLHWHSRSSYRINSLIPETRQPYCDDNQIRVLEDKIKDACTDWYKYGEKLAELAKIPIEQKTDYYRTEGDYIVGDDAGVFADVSNLKTSDKLFCILLAVLGDSRLRQKLKGIK